MVIKAVGATANGTDPLVLLVLVTWKNPSLSDHRNQSNTTPWLGLQRMRLSSVTAGKHSSCPCRNYIVDFVTAALYY